MKEYLYLFLAVLFISCNSGNQNRYVISSREPINIVSAYSGSCPPLFKTKDGALIISWLRDISDTQAVLCYAEAVNGKDFGPAKVVAGSDNAYPHGENLPRVIKTPDGRILAAWGASNPNPANRYSGLVYYNWSSDNGKHWTVPQALSKDPNSIDQRYFDVDILKDGRAAVIWLDNRKITDKEGSALYFATFNENNELENERTVGVTCCQCCRTDLLVDKDGNVHMVYRKIINDSIRDMVHSVSFDNGNTFSVPQRISPDNWVVNGCPHTGPAMAQTPEGLSFVWYTAGNGAGVYYTSSEDNGKTFSGREPVSARPSAKHPQIQITGDGKQWIVWDEGSSRGGRIGLEIRSPEGKKLEHIYLTDSVGTASFPVIKPSSGDQLIVAFSGRQNAANKEQVFYKIINEEY